MDGTREEIQGEIRAWVKNHGAHQICCLAVKLGSGKSSIAKTGSGEADRDSAIILGGTFFCSPSSRLAAQHGIRCVVPSLAQPLAQNSAEFRQALFETIDSSLECGEVAMQIEKLLYTPHLALKFTSVSILFVIDALEKCDGETPDGMRND